ncbi:MAG: Uncharacterized protein JWQ69_335, partial [Pseudomonas sp.]|nr:Uncharacterized protein [Pseudomonas sp.]
MEQLNDKQKPSSDDYFRVTNAAGVLAAQACTVSAKHIQDGMLRLQFNREVAYYARGIVRDVAEGRKSAEDGLKELTDELKLLGESSPEIGRKSVGVTAGVFQVIGGIAMCAVSKFRRCTFGAVTVAHGSNNVIENSVNVWNGNSEAQGPVRKIYQGIAKTAGGSESTGDKAYAFIDLTTSTYGVFRKVPKPDSWRLYRSMPTDSVRAYKLTSKTALSLEALSDAITL